MMERSVQGNRDEYQKIDGLYEFRCGRLAIYQRIPEVPLSRRTEIRMDEAPGFWYFQLGHWWVSLLRKMDCVGTP